jgi:hypothetical protein
VNCICPYESRILFSSRYHWYISFTRYGGVDVELSLGDLDDVQGSSAGETIAEGAVSQNEPFSTIASLSSLEAPSASPWEIILAFGELHQEVRGNFRQSHSAADPSNNIKEKEQGVRH